MQSLLLFLAQSILPHSDAVEVTENSDEVQRTAWFTLLVHPEDAGLAIGRNGRTAYALLDILKIKALTENKKVFLDIKPKEV